MMMQGLFTEMSGLKLKKTPMDPEPRAVAENPALQSAGPICARVGAWNALMKEEEEEPLQESDKLLVKGQLVDLLSPVYRELGLAVVRMPPSKVRGRRGLYVGVELAGNVQDGCNGEFWSGDRFFQTRRSNSGLFLRTHMVRPAFPRVLQGCDLSKLPTEVFVTLYGHLDEESRFNLACVCSRALRVYRAPLTWRQLCAERTFLSEQELHTAFVERGSSWRAVFRAFRPFRLYIVEVDDHGDAYRGGNVGGMRARSHSVVKTLMGHGEMSCAELLELAGGGLIMMSKFEAHEHGFTPPCPSIAERQVPNDDQLRLRDVPLVEGMAFRLDGPH